MKRAKEKSLSGGRHPLRPVGLVIGLAVMSLLSGWWTYPANAVEEGSIPGVSIEVSFEGLDVVASSSAPIRVELDQGATVTVSVLETGTSNTPAVFDDPSVLLELEDPSGSRTRFADWEQVSETEYRTDLTFSEPGSWRLVALPDLEDRSLLLPGSTDVVVVTVEEPLVQSTQGAGDFGLLLLGGLLLLTAVLVRHFTRHKLPWDHRPRSPSASRDTWWNSP